MFKAFLGKITPKNSSNKAQAPAANHSSGRGKSLITPDQTEEDASDDTEIFLAPPKVASNGNKAATAHITGATSNLDRAPTITNPEFTTTDTFILNNNNMDTVPKTTWTQTSSVSSTPQASRGVELRKSTSLTDLTGAETNSRPPLTNSGTQDNADSASFTVIKESIPTDSRFADSVMGNKIPPLDDESEADLDSSITSATASFHGDENDQARIDQDFNDESDQQTLIKKLEEELKNLRIQIIGENDLREQITKQAKEIDGLNEKMHILQNGAQQPNRQPISDANANELQQMQQALRELTTKLQEFLKQQHNLEQHIATSQQKIERLREVSKEFNDENNRLSDQNKQLLENAEGFSEEKHRLDNQRRVYESAIQDQRRLENSYNELLQKYQPLKEFLDTGVDTVYNRNVQLNAQINESQEQISIGENAIKDQRKFINILKEKITELQEQIAHLQKQSANSQSTEPSDDELVNHLVRQAIEGGMSNLVNEEGFTRRNESSEWFSDSERQLQEHVTRLQEQLESMRKRDEISQDRSSKLELKLNKLNDLLKKKEDLIHNLENATDERDHLIRQLQNAKDEIGFITSTLQDNIGEINTLKERIKALNGEKSEVTTLNQTQAMVLKDTLNEIKHLHEQISRRNTEVGELHLNHRSLQNIIEQKEQTIIRLQGEIERLISGQPADVSATNALVSRYHTELDEKNLEISRFTSNIRTIQEELRQKEGVITTLRLQVQKLMQLNTEANQAADAEVAKLESKMRPLYDELETSRNQAHAVQTESERLKSERLQLHSEISRLRSLQPANVVALNRQITTLDTQVKNLTLQLDAKTRMSTDLQADNIGQRRANTEIASELAALKSRTDDELNALQTKRDRLQQQLNQTATDITTLKRSNANLVQSETVAKNLNAILQRTQTQMQDRLYKLDTTINRLVALVPTTPPTRINVVRALAAGTILVGAGSGATLLTFKFLGAKSPALPQKLLEVIKTPEGIIGTSLAVIGIIGMIILSIVARLISKDYEENLHLVCVSQAVGKGKEDRPTLPT